MTLEERAEKLKMYSNNFGYKIMGVTDENVNVYSSNDKSGNLARRDFMQELYATGKNQVTDVYTAGEDGTLLIYTIAVPVMEGGRVAGSVWSSLGYDELEEFVLQDAVAGKINLVLFGNSNTVICSSEQGAYDKTLSELNEGAKIFNSTIKDVENNMAQGISGSYLGYKEGALWYVEYKQIAGTSWNIMYRGNIMGEAFAVIELLGVEVFLIIIFGILVEILLRRYLGREVKQLEATMSSIQEMQCKLQGNQETDYQDFLDISSQGLVDNLTGLATRVMFARGIEGKMAMVAPGKCSMLCFVDLDDLKLLNDSHGHECGDMALKNIGYTLRKYEKLYDGMAGRYGGDEFIIFLTDFADEAAAEKVLKSMVDALSSDLEYHSETVRIHCSIGAVIYMKESEDIKELILKADKALYNAKHRGKNTYSIYEA